ncbi:hypothetical protein QYG89_14665 [Bacillus sp. B190/17]|uniref:VCBS repeat-containing protein n=1 Tax=Bacillus lumedeiriae TaxID=3058829 RepID=A0ABW8ICK7_9BACI
MKIILPILLAFGVLHGFPIVVHADEGLMKIVQEFKPPGSLLVSPEQPISVRAIQLYDFNNDGQKEIIFTFEVKAKEQPAPSQFGVIALEKKNKGWQKVWETKTQGVGLGFSGLADITGDGTKEYLFGVTAGAAAGSQLDLFQWEDHSFKKAAEVPYHKMDLVNENQKVGIAVWQMYIGDSYLVDVLTWNGEKLVYDEELYSEYYPIIETFYQEKILKMDAWFYWYCLADAQIKANQIEKAAASIQKGRLLAKQLSMQEVVQGFNELNNKLEEKKKLQDRAPR